MVLTSSRPPGRQRDAVRDHLGDRRDRQALEQCDALAQGRLEGDLAAHRALSDRRDVRLQPHIVGEFVDALLADHGRIHVGDEQRLAPRRRRLDDHVDRRVSERGAQPLAQSLCRRRHPA